MRYIDYYITLYITCSHHKFPMNISICVHISMVEIHCSIVRFYYLYKNIFIYKTDMLMYTYGILEWTSIHIKRKTVYLHIHIYVDCFLRKVKQPWLQFIGDELCKFVGGRAPCVSGGGTARWMRKTKPAGSFTGRTERPSYRMSAVLWSEIRRLIVLDCSKLLAALAVNDPVARTSKRHQVAC